VKNIKLKYLKTKNTLKDWLIKKAGTITMALSNVEKSALNQTGELMSSDINHAQRHTQGQVVDSLINGEITQEVMDLRWRMYKIIQETGELTTKIIGYEDDGTPITKTTKKDNKKGLKKIKIDTHDTYPLEFVIPNDEIATSSNDAMTNQYIKILDEPTINYDEDGAIVSATHGEISGEEYYFTHKTEKPIIIKSEATRRFYLENFTKKLNVRNISNTEKLLEFYVSIYPDVDNRTSRIFLSELKKIINDNKKSDIIDINEVMFITYKGIGVNDFLEYKYNITSFDKIIEFNGNYVIKFKAETIINGEDILTKYKQDELELKYQNKVKK
jgi:hypothetical protein